MQDRCGLLCSMSGLRESNQEDEGLNILLPYQEGLYMHDFISGWLNFQLFMVNVKAHNKKYSTF